MGRRTYTDKFRAAVVVMLEAAGYSLNGNCTIYGIFQSGKDEPFYIGSTRYEINDRFAAHMYEVEHEIHSNRYFTNKTKKCGVSNVECFEICKIGTAKRYFAERDVIKWCVEKGVKLTNKVYNGINFDIGEAVYEYRNHPGLTPDREELLMSDGFLDGDGWLQVALSDLIISSLDEMVKRFNKQFREDHPGLFDWYMANYGAANS